MLHLKSTCLFGKLVMLHILYKRTKWYWPSYHVAVSVLSSPPQEASLRQNPDMQLQGQLAYPISTWFWSMTPLPHGMSFLAHLSIYVLLDPSYFFVPHNPHQPCSPTSCASKHSCSLHKQQPCWTQRSSSRWWGSGRRCLPWVGEESCRRIQILVLQQTHPVLWLQAKAMCSCTPPTASASWCPWSI